MPRPLLLPAPITAIFEPTSILFQKPAARLFHQVSDRLFDIEFQCMLSSSRRLQRGELAVEQRWRHEMAIARLDALFENFTAAGKVDERNGPTRRSCDRLAIGSLQGRAGGHF